MPSFPSAAAHRQRSVHPTSPHRASENIQLPPATRPRATRSRKVLVSSRHLLFLWHGHLAHGSTYASNIGGTPSIQQSRQRRLFRKISLMRLLIRFAKCRSTGTHGLEARATGGRLCRG